ncbi:MAG TPA: multicopper oxidase domain-containing protein [Gemmatimonadota bacterium]|nr:multicopper oxidase domain-containing protein [Gemmatimonadota bacterium]
MIRFSVSLPVAALAALLLPVAVHGQANLAGSVQPPRILPNDNREPAGVLEGGVLTLHLDAREGMWHPHGSDRAGIRIGAFAEEGEALEIPGPMIRVPVGTEVRTTVRNSLEKPLAVFGLGAERGVSGDSVLVAPGGEAEFAFVASKPGTYYYLGRTEQPGVPDPLWTGSLHGAIVVDPPGAAIRPGDRVFVISSWFTFDTTNFSDLSDDAVITANGLAWPHTEVVEATEGDSLEWRWINLSALDHPMHLHGFHFRVDARGDGMRDTLYPLERRQLAVTEHVGPGETATTTWSPDRSGNWIFHCHMLSHMSTIEIVNSALVERGTGHGHDAQHMMGMLVVGIRVRPSGPAEEKPAEARRLRLLIRSRPDVYGKYPGYAYVLGGSREAEDPDALTVPGPTLVLEKDERVAITLVNESHEPAAVHWHGIELESYPDGVPGWSGGEERVLPAIAPGDSLTVRFTPPRAGTFMYHSHFNEMQQTSSGLYGPIVVLEPGATFDPETDRVLVFSDGGPWSSFIDPSTIPPTLLNGRVDPEPLELRAGTTYRFRLINILTETRVRVGLHKEEEPVEWRAVAKDGADLPPSLATAQPARLGFLPGEIYDFEFTPESRGELELAFGKGEPETFTRVPVLVR